MMTMGFPGRGAAPDVRGHILLQWENGFKHTRRGERILTVRIIKMLSTYVAESPDRLSAYGDARRLKCDSCRSEWKGLSL